MKKNNLQETILESASKIALEQGLNKVNIRAVAKSSNISIGSVYNYYPNKSNLLIAIIEKFWIDAFKLIDFSNLIHLDFYEKITVIYTTLYDHLQGFRKNLLDGMADLNIEEKKMGRKREMEYFSKIEETLNKMLTEKNIDNRFTNEKLSKFIMNNMMLMLKNNDKDIDFFISILKKILN